MERFDVFLDTILKEEQDKGLLKPLFMKQLVHSYKYYRKKGYSDAEAYDQALFYFGTEEIIQKKHDDFKLENEHKRFLELYPRLIKGGIAGIFIIPLIFLFLVFTLEAKLYFLVLWIVSIIFIAVFLILVDYKHYQYKEKLEQKEAHK